MAKEALIGSKAAIAAVRDHEHRCLEATRETNAELVRQRRQQESNHAAVMAAHGSMAALQRDSASGLRQSLESRCGDIYQEISELKSEGAARQEDASKKESNFYRAVAGGSLMIIFSLVAFLWSAHDAGVVP